MADKDLAYRLGQLTLRTAAGVDPGPVSEEEWQVFTRFIRSAVPNWQRIGLLPRTQDPLDLTPTDVQNRYRRWPSWSAWARPVDPLAGWPEPRRPAEDLRRPAAARPGRTPEGRDRAAGGVGAAR